MATEYCRSMLRICIAQLCQNLGWSATQSSPLELLTDVLEQYLIDLGKTTHRYSEQFGRTEPNLDDLALTFRHYGIQLGELEDYIRHVEPMAFAREVVSFPARKRNNLNFPNPRSRELLQHREEHVPNHLPYMYSGMEEEVEEEPSQPTQPSLPTPQLPQESVSPMAISPTPSDKRPLSNSAEGPPPKRPRLTSANLPEEAGHSQYEMKSVLVNPSGVLTPTRQGKLPDARTPPTFRQVLQFKDEKDIQKNRDDKTATPKKSEKTTEENRDKSNNCSEIVAPKKKMLKQYKMAADSAAAAMPRSPKVTKLARSPKPGSPLGTKSPKPKQKAKAKGKGEVGAPGESCLKDLLLSSKMEVDRGEKPLTNIPPTSSPKPKSDTKQKSKKKTQNDTQGTIRETNSETLFSPDIPSHSEPDGSSRLTFNLEEESSRDDSPERLVIAESETKGKATKETRDTRLAHIDDSIDCVIRDSVAEMDQRIGTSEMGDTGHEPSPKLEKAKKRDKPKSGKDFEKQKRKEKKDKSDAQSINNSIEAVIRKLSDENQPGVPSSAAVSAESIRKEEELSSLVRDSPFPQLAEQKKPSKPDKTQKEKGKSGRKKKDKEGSTKDRLIEKLTVKTERQYSDSGVKPSVLDKFSSEEYSVFEFPESPPSLPPQPKKNPKSGTSPKQAVKTPVPAPTPPPVPVPAPQPVQHAVSPPLPPPITSPLLPPVVKDEPSSAPVSDILPMTLKIDLKHKKDKERSKDKEHKKEKKEKKKDKEKKKKNKDKEKSRDKSKSREDRHREEKDMPGMSPTGLGGPIKLNIKFGGSSAATSTVVTEPKLASPKTEPVPASPKTLRPEPLLSPKREIPKLVIKPIRRESLEAKAKLGAASRSPAVMSPPPKSPTPPPPPAPLQPPPAPTIERSPTPPPPKVPTPPPPSPPKIPTPPPPKVKTPPKPVLPSPSPSPPRHESPPPKSPTPSPSPPRLSPSPVTQKSPSPPPHSPSPPPRSPSPVRVRTPSPKPKRSPVSSPVRSPVLSRSPSPQPKFKRSQIESSPSPPPSPPPESPKSPASLSPASPGRLEVDIQPEKKTTTKTKQTKSPKGKPDKKSSPKGKRGRKPKEKEEKKEEPGTKAARVKSVPSVTSETVSETPIQGPIVQRTVVAETVGSFIDGDGNKVWICPACKIQDDGSPMIGCDICDDWYHWVCMNITQEPEEDEWFCPRCKDNRTKSKTPKGKPPLKGKKRGRKKKST